MTSAEAVQEMGSWMSANVAEDTLSKLMGADEAIIGQVAEDIYEQHGSDDTLSKLLGCLTGRRTNHTLRPAQAAKLRAVHLSGMRSALQLMATSVGMQEVAA